MLFKYVKECMSKKGIPVIKIYEYEYEYEYKYVYEYKDF